MKGIILAGGAGTRLYPLTSVVSKQLLPVYDKPMIYYPLSTIMLAGIKDILVISTAEDLPSIERLLGKGTSYGINLSYCVQPSPDGLAQAFLLGESFIGDDPCCLILGDNVFYGNGLGRLLDSAINNAESGNATVFGYYVSEPQRFGIIGFNDKGEAESIEEKPVYPKSNYAVTGMYFYPSGIVSKARRIIPSERGELEITSLNEMYLKENRLSVQLLGRGFSWFDAGTIDSLAEADEFVRVVQSRQGVEIAALEEIAFRNGWISKDELVRSADKYGNSPYGRHLWQVADGKIRY